MGRRSSPLQRVQYSAQRLRFDVAANPHAIAARHFNLYDVSRGCRRRRRRRRLLRCHNHRHKLRCRHVRCLSIELAPSETWLVFTSYCRATIDTEAPGTAHAATIARFSASYQPALLLTLRGGFPRVGISDSMPWWGDLHRGACYGGESSDYTHGSYGCRVAGPIGQTCRWCAGPSHAGVGPGFGWPVTE